MYLGSNPAIKHRLMRLISLSLSLSLSLRDFMGTLRSTFQDFGGEVFKEPYETNGLGCERWKAVGGVRRASTARKYWVTYFSNRRMSGLLRKRRIASRVHVHAQAAGPQLQELVGL